MCLSVCQRFQTLIPTSLKQFYSSPRGPTCCPDFHTVHCTPLLFNLNSTDCTCYLTSNNAITPFTCNIHQLFNMLLLDCLLIIPTFIFKKTSPNNIFLLPNPLFGNSKELMTIKTRINLLCCLSSFLIHSHIYYSFNAFLCLIMFLPIFLIQTLFPNPK